MFSVVAHSRFGPHSNALGIRDGATCGENERFLPRTMSHPDNEAAPVNAPIARRVHSGHTCGCVSEQRRSAQSLRVLCPHLFPLLPLENVLV